MIPGSHRPGLHHALAPLQRAHYIESAHPDELHLISADPTWSDATFGVVGTELPSTVCEAQPGDVLFCAIPRPPLSESDPPPESETGTDPLLLDRHHQRGTSNDV